MKKRIIAIVIARMTSTRLPGKVLMDICGRPMLGHIIDRVKKVKCIDEIVLATTNKNEDKSLIEFAKKEKIKSFAYEGDPEDVTSRATEAAKKFQAGILVKVAGDCPLIDPGTINKLVKVLVKDKSERACIASKKGRKPIHQGFSIYTRKGWEKVDKNTVKKEERVNLVASLTSHPELLKTSFVQDEPIFYEIQHRITVDTWADLEFMREIHKKVSRKEGTVDLREVIKLLQKEPELMEINSRVRQKKLQDRSRKVFFRVDAGREFGMGHLIRCFALASELQERYFCGISFVTRNDDGIAEMIKRRGFEVKILPQDISKDDEVNRLMEFAKNWGAERFILDLKGKIDTKYISRLKELNIPIICIDNEGGGALLANVNIFPVVHFTPDRKWKSCKGKLYYGPKYVILRREFQKDYPHPNNRVPNVLITMGGSDTENLTKKVLSAILPIPDIHITIILGKFFARYNKIRQMIRGRNNITIYQDVTNMAEIMTKADLAVTYFGVTAYELAKMGIPAIVIAHSREDITN